jgi:redox-sensitive bicupin YhaK (pirin superfamily)
MTTRPVLHAIDPMPASDGAGVRLLRAIGSPRVDHLDPFLLLDEFKSDKAGDYIAGFPDHPHRGFETVTYMLAGSMEHRDHAGGHGRLEAGSIQWMTAGRGIVHSEMPMQEDGLMWGFQLWVNLPAADKMCAPRYQDIPPEAVPEVPTDGGVVRVLAGEHGGATGPVQGVVTSPLYLDVRLEEGGRFETELPPEHNAFAYVYDGEVEGHRGPKLLVLGDGDRVALSTAAGGRALLVAARPLDEPIARYGPFVMNTKQELVQAFRDFESGRF